MSITVVQGSAADLTLQCKMRAGGNAKYTAADALSAEVRPYRSSSAVFTPAVAWYTPNAQTGYDQGQVMASIAASQMAMLMPSIPYTLMVWRTPTDATRTELIVRVKLVVEPGAIPG